MKKIIDEFKLDFNFVKSHSMQPKWYKFLKVFILLGFLLAYYFLFGWKKTVLFLAAFIILSALVHLVYRIKTNKWKQSWLDFIVVEENGEMKPKRIGKYYYLAIVINAIISIAISQVLM
jgi:hypothetical protein